MQGHGYTGPLTACANITEDVKMLIGRFLNLKNMQRKPMDIGIIASQYLIAKERRISLRF
jgi:hypothetical protein